MKSFKIKLIIIHCIIPIMIGGLLYVFFRSTSIRMFKWFDFLGLENVIQLMRSTLFNVKSNIPNWIYFSLPDGLWVYSFTRIWLLIPFISGILSEILQYFGLFPGTFDYLDLCFSLFCIFLSIFIINLNYKHYDKKVF